MSPAATVTPARAPVALRHRRNIDQLTIAQVADLREAIKRTQAIGDDRGYQAWAGIHGLPLPISCTHHNELFLPWHRAYLYTFEKALQDQLPGVTLAWWDWAADPGIPSAYGRRRTPDNKVNPLYGSPIQPAGRRAPNEARTWRQPGQDGALPTQGELNAVLANPDFFTFQTQLESLHDGVHIWVGGTMGSIAVAAYDPVFWAHHTMIDRVWYLWQLRRPGAGATLPAALLNRALPPFALTVRDTLSTAHLGYDYAAATRAAAGPGGAPVHAHA